MPRALVHDQTMTGAAIPAPGLLGDLGLRGAAIIVTGASSGIGAATATALATAGASVVLVGRREDALKAQADVVAEAGAEALAVPADMAEPDSPARIAAACRDRFGRIDGVVNNAAVVRHRPLADWADDLEVAYQWLAEQVPLGRIGEADEVARWIAFLLSPVSAFMTGAVIPLDGGQVIHRV
jgi:NAD(P)-dependent dehydrogenase (short-subunit alcohol dehydrogenase family)